VPASRNVNLALCLSINERETEDGNNKTDNRQQTG
jgi:hypothetical protein